MNIYIRESIFAFVNWIERA